LKINYKINDKVDFLILVPLIILMGIGLLAIYSSTYNHPTMHNKFEKQLFWCVISLFLFLIIYFIPHNFFRIISLPSYLFSIFLLLLVLVIGRQIKGAESWLRIGPVGFQPAEVAKIGLILFLSHYLSNMKKDINNIKELSIALGIGLLPILLILKQPDMGTAIVFGCILLALLFWNGISLFSLFVVLLPGIMIFVSMFGGYVFAGAMILVLVLLILFKRNIFISASIFVANLASGFFFDFAFKLLKPHQQQRILSFLNPTADPLGSGYNITQAQVAIGSGGFWGKGFLAGNQTQNKFIPEQWTDFIYCVIGEEFGFIGSVLIIVLFTIIFIRLLKLTSIAKDKFSSSILIGVLTLIFVHFAINIGMNLGIAPVIGLPLPFLSYGGTSLAVNTLLMGIVLNIYRNRKIRA